MAQNSIYLIHPYKHHGTWVFDDETVGLVKEPFVAGADDIIDQFVADIAGAGNGFALLFSANPFPGSDAVFEWRRTEGGGNWYFSKDLNKEGWLCPALFKYFNTAPSMLYVQFKKKGAPP